MKEGGRKNKREERNVRGYASGRVNGARKTREEHTTTAQKRVLLRRVKPSLSRGP
jgi:hypothetical protein